MYIIPSGRIIICYACTTCADEYALLMMLLVILQSLYCLFRRFCRMYYPARGRGACATWFETTMIAPVAARTVLAPNGHCTHQYQILVHSGL